MLKYYVKEYCAVVDHLLGQREAAIKDGLLYVRKKQLAELLNKNAFETVEQKIKYWKALGWIRAEDGRTTKRLRNKEKGITERYIAIKLLTHQTLKELVADEL